VPTTKKKTARTDFLALLVAGPDAAAAESAAERFSSLVDGPIVAASTEKAAALVRVPGATGAVLLVPLSPFDRAQLRAALDAFRAADPGLPVVLLADRLDAAEAVGALRAGAAEAVFRETAPDEARARLAALIGRRAARASGQLFPEDSGAPRILGASPEMREVARFVERVAGSDATVLILGESGTGKELIAQALHALSPRSRGPFIAINCAAIPETLLENELFGHEKGSYTGASSTQMGKVEAAERGTLFLDEIGEMPLPLQAKILRLLQEKTYDRIGGTRTRKADVRIVAATNRGLKEEVAARRFREDLYYRLSVLPIALPALRERPGDIAIIADAILEKLAASMGRAGLRFSDDARRRLVEYRWPGNVRELENEIERAVVLAGRDVIEPSDFELRSRVEDPDRAALARIAPLDGPLAATLKAATESASRIRAALALEETRGDHARAAEMLGVSEDDLARMVGD